MTDADRLKRAQEIADEVKAGVYQPARVNLEQSWFPVRKAIPKDLKAMNKLYGEPTK